MVYTDGVHVVANSLEELHSFASKIGLRSESFESSRIPHYLLTSDEVRNKAAKEGVIKVKNSVELLKKISTK